MMNTKIFEKKSLIIVFACLITFMVIGSFFDYQISSTLFNPNSIFGVIFAGYGQAPSMLCMSIGGILLVYIVDKKSKVKMILSYVFGLLLSVYAIMGITVDPILYIKMPLVISLMIAVAIVIITDLLIIKLVKNTNREDIKKFIVLLITVSFLNVLIINVIKIPWGRPRMRMISITPEAAFQQWWVFGSQLKEQLITLGVASEEFKSFPSGHAGNAACLMVIGVFPILNGYFKGKENLLFFSGFVFALIVSLSRLIMGAHFLTDITIGITITFVIEVVMVHILWKRGAKNGKI